MTGIESEYQGLCIFCRKPCSSNRLPLVCDTHENMIAWETFKKGDQRGGDK